MGIPGDYPQPVQVNGYTCRNCTDVDNAKKHIDPTHPKDGPFGIDKPTKPNGGSPAFSFGGVLKGRELPAAAQVNNPCRTGACLDISA